MHRIQNTMGATSLAFSMSGLRFPGYGLEKVGLGLVLVSAPLTLAIVYGTLQARRIEAEALRRPELRGLPLDQVIKQFCGPDTAAAHFDWNAPGLFVNTMGTDMTDEVSHILARAFAAAGTPAGSSLAPELRAYADNLASSADLRTALAQTAYEANAACDDRVGIRLGELMLAGIMHTVRDKAAKPRAVVGTLVLHAATRAMERRISALLAQGQAAPEAAAPPPSAELMLAGCHAVQAALIRRGMAVPNLFREQLFSMDDLRRHRNNVVAAAEDIADACCPPTASGEQAGHAVAVFLKHHGGEAAMQILSTRLAHLTEPLEADVQKALGALDEALEESTDPTNPVMTDEQYRHEADQLKRDYDAGVARVRAQAIAGALAGEDADWMAPEAPASTSEPAPLQDPGETSADAEANASQAPHGYDPTKGKWKTD
ncbi:type III effector protein [Ralstonia solanacearum]|uniref:type III effector protein n=1 Tax=Ralstonia solanacearum TaxID=305 RepID=UPI001E566657|nr:type III effector protein [Ralstonia solanacearum]